MRAPYIIRDIRLQCYVVYDPKWYPFDQYGLDCAIRAFQTADRKTGEPMWEEMHYSGFIKNLDPIFVLREGENPPEKHNYDGFSILITRSLYLQIEFIILFFLILSAVFIANRVLKSQEFLSFAIAIFFSIWIIRDILVPESIDFITLVDLFSGFCCIFAIILLMHKL